MRFEVIEAEGEEYVHDDRVRLLRDELVELVRRERNGVAEAMKLKQRGLDKVSTKQLGDVLRSAELTINIEPDILLCETGIIENPD